MGFPCEEEFKKKLETAEYLTLDELLCEPVWKRLPRPLKIIVKALQHFNSVAPYRSIRYRVSKNHNIVSDEAFTVALAVIGRLANPEFKRIRVLIE